MTAFRECIENPYKKNFITRKLWSFLVVESILIDVTAVQIFKLIANIYLSAKFIMVLPTSKYKFF
jgi:hypothetical protein